MARRARLMVNRRSFDLDNLTLDDLKTIQLALRCRSGTEAVREAIRRTAILMKLVQDGRCIVSIPEWAEMPFGAWPLDYPRPDGKTR